MSGYTNITYSLGRPAQEYIETNWVDSEDTNFFKKYVLARGGHLVLTPWSAITSVADSIVGIGAGIATIATIGKHTPTYFFAMNHLDSSSKIVARPYLSLLKTLNPKAKVSCALDNTVARTIVGHKNPLISGAGDGFITHYVSTALRGLAKSCYNSNNLLKRHVASRLTYVLLAISCVITRLVDAIIGVVAAVLSFLTLGKVESINNLAYRALQAPGIVKDLFYCTTKMINPFAGTHRSTSQERVNVVFD